MTSTSTVGLPRLSRISRPMMSVMAVMDGSDIGNAGLLQNDYPLVMPCAKRASKRPQTLRQTNGEETTAAGPPKPNPQFPGSGRPRPRAEPTYGDELYCTVQGPRVHDSLPHHRPA